MQRISEPQMVEALTLSRTSQCPGRGVDSVRSSTLSFPGRNAASMLCSIFFTVEFTRIRVPQQSVTPAIALRQSGRRDLAIQVPEVFPRLSFFPEKHLTFDEPAIPVNCADFTHLILSQRLAYDPLEVAKIMIPVG
jgi:hypothetical protein